MKCKWAGDVADEYCKNCNGATMDVDGKSISCEECAGYEAGAEDAGEFMNVPDIPVDADMTPTEEDEKTVDDASSKLNKKSDEKPEKAKSVKTNTAEVKKSKNDKKNKETISKVKEEKNAVEHVIEHNGKIKVVSMRYTSGATVKKGDNYFKFIAEEEWDTSQVDNVDEAREKLWAKLNGEVDKQIEELQNMN